MVGQGGADVLTQLTQSESANVASSVTPSSAPPGPLLGSALRV